MFCFNPINTQGGGLTCDNAIVGGFQHGSIKLNDVLMTQDTENLSLEEETRRKKRKSGINNFTYV